MDEAHLAVGEVGGRVSQPIINGTPATAYTEAALINMPTSICSGAVIAPYVVLTAGHCAGGNSFTVVAPHAGNQTAKGVSKWTNYVNTAGVVNPNTLDVAVIILDRAINLTSYPQLASTPQPDGTLALNVGRIRNGVASYSQLFYGRDVSLSNGSSNGFPLAYSSEEIVQPGDSGGPVYVGSGANRVIVAVNSGAGGGQILARVDLAYAKIQQLIAANGGGGTGTPPPPPPPPQTCSGTGEAEPNDVSTSANALAGTSCGALSSSSDVDWYTWSVPGSGVAYDVSLTATDSADLLMWKRVPGDNTWHPISNKTPTNLAGTSNGSGQYVVAVRGSTAQSYTLTLTR